MHEANPFQDHGVGAASNADGGLPLNTLASVTFLLEFRVVSDALVVTRHVHVICDAFLMPNVFATERLVNHGSRPLCAMPRFFRQSLFLVIALLPTIVTVGCLGSIYQWETQTRSTATAPSSLLLTERLAVLPALTVGSQVGSRQALSSAFDRAMLSTTPETTLIPSHDVVSLINTKGLTEDYGKLAAAYAEHGIHTRTLLAPIGLAIGARYVFQPTLSSFEQTIEERFTMLGYRLLQTRTSSLRLALQLWDTHTGAIVWSSTGETTVASDVLHESRIPFDLAAEILWKAMILDLRDHHTTSTYTYLDQIFQDLLPTLHKPESAPRTKDR